MGWPLGSKAGGGSFIYHLDNNQVYVGFVVHLNYENPVPLSLHGVPAVQAPQDGGGPSGSGKRVAYGARAISEGGWQSMPKAVAPGLALLGCSVGMVNVPRIKGNHNAMLSASRRPSCRGRDQGRRARATSFRPMTRRCAPVRSRETSSPYGTSSRSGRNTASSGASARRRRHVDGQSDRAQPIWHDGLRKVRCRGHEAAKGFAPIEYPKPDGVLSFDRLTNVSFS
jgi:electron-transferring-flavoprotein dehydrogenase